jgi:hypothetical protein
MPINYLKLARLLLNLLLENVCFSKHIKFSCLYPFKSSTNWNYVNVFLSFYTLYSFITGSASLCRPWPLFLFSQSVFSTYSRTPWTSDQSIPRPPPTQDNITQKDQGQTSTHTGQHNTERPRTNIHALSGIQNRDPVYERSGPTQTARPLDRKHAASNRIIYSLILTARQRLKLKKNEWTGNWKS